MSKERVLVDACVIFPAMRINEWNRLRGHFAMETVDEVVEEPQRGDVNRRGYVKVDQAQLLKSVKARHPVSEEDPGALAEKMAGGLLHRGLCH
jgi:hypothetical protein